MDNSESPVDIVIEFLTENEENYLGMVKAKDYYPKVKERLIKDLWNMVYQLLHEAYESSTKWQPYVDSNFKDQFAKVYIKPQNLPLEQNQLPPLLIGWERLQYSFPYYGLWINLEGQNQFDYQTLFEKEKNLYQEIGIIMEYSDEGTWWLIWKADAEINFDNAETLVNILPQNLEYKASKMVKEIINLQRILDKKGVIERFWEKYKK